MPETTTAATDNPTHTDALQEVGAIVQGLLAQRTIEVKNPSTSEMETRTVPVKGITVDTEMNGANGEQQTIVFRVLLDHGDTIHQKAIAEQALAVLSEINPAFKATEGGNPVRIGSYRDDTHVSLIADVPADRTPADVLAEIIHTKTLGGEMTAAAEAVQNQPAVSDNIAQMSKPSNSIAEILAAGPRSPGDLLTMAPPPASAVEKLTQQGATAAEAEQASGRVA